jgi:asparagine synthase (glutamine-hydrolysing)
VVALAAQALDPFEAFIVSHDESEEVAQARQLAELWGVQLRVLRPDVEAVLDAVIDGQRLVHDLGTSAQLLLSRGIEAAGYSVVLTGDGAEELLFGPDHLGQMQSWDEPTLAGVQRLLGFVPGFMRSGAILGQRLRSVMHPDFLASQENCDPFFEMTQALALDGLEPLEQSSRLLARLVERKAIQGARCPYYDYRLVELVSRLPMRFKVRGSVRQYVLREAVAPLIPRSLYVSEGPARLRFGFGRALVDRLRGLSLGREHPFIDRSRLLSRLDQLEREDRPEWESALLWLLSAYSLA